MATKLLNRLFLMFLLVVLTTKISAIEKDSTKVYNKGISGNNTYDLLQRVQNDVMLFPNGIVVMMVGTNDMINSAKLVSLDEFSRNYQNLINTIKKKHQLILLTLPPFYEPYLLSRHPQEAYGKDGPTKRLKDANETIKILAGKNKCALIDLNKILEKLGGADTDSMSLFRNEANSNIKDGVHFTKTGYGVIATLVYQYLNDNNLIDENLICFGDSLTYGLGVNGRGTTTGFTYPAILKNLLN